MPARKTKAASAPKKTMSPAEAAARARSLKARAGMAEAFGVVDDYPREFVKVDSLPDPPATEVIVQAQSGRRAPVTERVSLDEAIMTILREEAEEIGLRFERFGIPFTAAMKQDMIDHIMTMVSMGQQGMQIGGGAMASR